MKIRRIVTAIVTGALAVSCLALATGCSGVDPALKDSFTKQYIENVPEGEYVDQTQYEITSMTAEDNKITVGLKNEHAEIEVAANYTEGSNGTYSFSNPVIKDQDIKILSGVSKMPGYEQYDPDYSNQEVVYEEGWKCKISFNNAPFYDPEANVVFIPRTCDGNKLYFDWSRIDSEQNLDLSNVYGTYTSSENESVVNLMKTGETTDDGYPIVEVVINHKGMKNGNNTLDPGTETYDYCPAKISKDPENPLQLLIACTTDYYGTDDLVSFTINADGDGTLSYTYYKKSGLKNTPKFELAKGASGYTKID